jgi:hypothetical protein
MVSSMKKKTVNRAPIDEWIREAYPNGLYKLAEKSGVPVNSLSKIRLGWVPRNERKRTDLAKTVGVKESELFPVLQDGKGKAS